MNYWIISIILIIILCVLYIVYRKVKKEKWLRVMGDSPLGSYIVLYDPGNNVDYSRLTMEVVVMGNNRVKNTVRIVGNNTNTIPIWSTAYKAFTLTGMGLIDLVPNGYNVYPYDTQPMTDLYILEIRIWNTGFDNLQLYVYNHNNYWGYKNTYLFLEKYQFYKYFTSLPSFERIIFDDTNIAWKHTYTEYRCDEDTDKCIRCKYNYGGNKCETCSIGFTGVNCDTCSTRFTGVNCDTCVNNFIGINCDTCVRNFTGVNCDTCVGNFTGVNCDTCSSRFQGLICDKCIVGFTGVNCDTTYSTNWTRKADIPNTYNIDMVSGTYGDTIVLIGSSIYKYSITNDSWTTVTFQTAWGGTTTFKMTNYDFSRGSPYWQVGSIIYMYCPHSYTQPYQLYRKMYTYNITTGTIEELLSPAGASLTPGVAIQYGTTWKDSSNNLWLFGGSTDFAAGAPSVDTLYRFNTNDLTWSTVTATGKPTARVGMKACTMGNITYLFGGGSTSDFYSFDNVSTFGVSNLVTKPSRRNYTCMWVIGTNIYLYGGIASSNSPGDNNMWRYNTSTQVWEIMGSVYSLDVRTSASAVVTGTNNVWILGGTDKTTLVDNRDVWTITVV